MLLLLDSTSRPLMEYRGEVHARNIRAARILFLTGGLGACVGGTVAQVDTAAVGGALSWTARLNCPSFVQATASGVWLEPEGVALPTRVRCIGEDATWTWTASDWRHDVDVNVWAAHFVLEEQSEQSGHDVIVSSTKFELVDLWYCTPNELNEAVLEPTWRTDSGGLSEGFKAVTTMRDSGSIAFVPTPNGLVELDLRAAALADKQSQSRIQLAGRLLAAGVLFLAMFARLLMGSKLKGIVT